jgi:prepilin-type N-terminal cleavage/methylation domain-containing protein
MKFTNMTLFPSEQEGFSLVELILTIVIMGILCAVVVAKFIDLSEAGKTSTCVTNQYSLETSQALYYSDQIIQNMDTAQYATQLGQLTPYVISGVIPQCPKGFDYIIINNGRIDCPLAQHKRRK